jgi:membrane-bound metal-dependent hydrolase YbcI (DUF457 family)
MLWQTHVLAGISSLWILEANPELVTGDTIGPLALLAAFGALLPDIDSARSKLSSLSVWGVRPLSAVATAVERAWGHRGWLHSPLGLLLAIAVSLLAFIWIGELAVAFTLGYASHLLLDACTPTGIPGSPWSRRIFLAPRLMRIATGSKAEEILLPVLAGLALALLLRQ